MGAAISSSVAPKASAVTAIEKEERNNQRILSNRKHDRDWFVCHVSDKPTGRMNESFVVLRLPKFALRYTWSSDNQYLSSSNPNGTHPEYHLSILRSSSSVVSWGSFLGLFFFFVDVVRGDGMTDDMVLMGVLGAPIPERDVGDDFGAILDIEGEPCRWAGRGVDSAEGTVVPAGEVITDELEEGASLGGGDAAARSCRCASVCCCCVTDP